MKVLVKSSANPLRELLSNIKRESMGPQDAKELLQYFQDMNTTFEQGPEGANQLAGRKLADNFPNQPTLSMRNNPSLARFQELARQQKEMDLGDDETTQRIADIMSGEAFPELKDIKGDLGQEYDAIRDNTDTHMQDIESEYERYKKLMTIIGNPIMGMKDFAEAKGWIQPNQRVGFLGLNDKQLLEQIRSGTSPILHPSQYSDMSLQEFDRNVPVESYSTLSQEKRGNHNDFINLMKLAQLDDLRANGNVSNKSVKIGAELSEFRDNMINFETAWKEAHNKHPHKNNGISYIDYDDWSSVHGQIFRKPTSYLNQDNPNIHLEKAMDTISPSSILNREYQGKKLPQLQDFVSHPAVGKYIEEVWDNMQNYSDGKGILGLHNNMDEEEKQKHQDIFDMHVNNKTDSLGIINQYYQKEYDNTHGINMHENIGPMPNYQNANQLNNSHEYHTPYYINDSGMQVNTEASLLG